jgi:hypothetical protein
MIDLSEITGTYLFAKNCQIVRLPEQSHFKDASFMRKGCGHSEHRTGSRHVHPREPKKRTRIKGSIRVAEDWFG